MASGSMHHHIDIEAQNLPSPLPEVGTSETHRMSIREPRDTGQAPPLAANQSTSFDLPQLVSQLEEFLRLIRSRGSEIQQGTDVHQSERGDGTRHATVGGEETEIQDETETPAVHGNFRLNSADINNQPIDGGPIGDMSIQEPQEKRMIGDFDGSANPLWSLYGKEAKSHDQSRIQTLKPSQKCVERDRGR